MPSVSYRYYCLDQVGRLHDATWFEADNDEEAVAKITEEHPDAMCEIWEGKRLVASIGPERDVMRSSAEAIARSLNLLTETARLVS